MDSLSCKRRGFCPSCAGRRMSESAAFFVDRVLPHERIRQWVFSFPIPMRYWMAKNPKWVTRVLTLVIRALSSFQSKRARKLGIKQSQSGSLTLVQRFGDAIRLNIHFHILMIEGVYEDRSGQAIFHKLSPPSDKDVAAILQKVQKGT
jgi:hypothetical protein